MEFGPKSFVPTKYDVKTGKESTECPYSTSNVKITCPKSKKCGDCLVYKAVSREKQDEH